jgi:hypothetical protein
MEQYSSVLNVVQYRFIIMAISFKSYDAVLVRIERSPISLHNHGDSTALYLLHDIVTIIKRYWTVFNTKRLLHEIFHIDPGISPRLPYQTRQRSCRADTISLHNHGDIIQKLGCSTRPY